MLRLHRNSKLPGITTIKIFLIAALTGLTSAVSYLHSSERWHPSGFLDKSELRIRRPVFSLEKNNRLSFNQTVLRDSFVHKKGTKDFSAECGIENKKASSHVQIVGGEEAKPNQWPWQVALNIDPHPVDNDTTGYGFCGGSLISDEWVMTAAHCAEDAHEFLVIAGAHNLDDVEPHRQEITSHEAIVYPGGHPGHMDIALIKLPEPIAFNEYMKPVCLPGRNEDASAGDKVTTTGWGETENGWASALFMVEQAIISNDDPVVVDCGMGALGNDVVCASVEGHKGSCYGDSGGPVVKKSTGRWIQQGIVSFGPYQECGTGFDGNTRVHYFLDWIETTTGIMIH